MWTIMDTNLESNSTSPSTMTTATSSTTGRNDNEIGTPTISSVVPASITLLAVVAMLVLACVIHRYRQKKKLTRRIRVTENRINSIANDLKATKAAAAVIQPQLNANSIIAQENQLQPLKAALAALPLPPPSPHSRSPTVCTTSVEMYRCQQQSVISHFNNEDRESSTSDEDYDTPTDVDTSEKETSYTHSFHHEQLNTYSFFSTPQRGGARFLSLQTIATFQNLNNCTLETHYNTTLSTGIIHHSPPHHSSVPAFLSTSTTGTAATTAILISDDMTISPSAHYQPSSDDRDTVIVPENTPNNSLQYSFRLPPNDSMCSKSTTLTMYTCPSSPIGSINTCIGDEDKASGSDDEEFVEAGSEYQTDTEVWV